jgi:hypothetical protein
MHWEVLPHIAYSADLVPSSFQLFGPLKEAPTGKRLLLTMKLNFLCNDGWMSNRKLLLKGA